MHNFARNLFKPMLLLPLIAIGGCAGFDLSGQWGRENAIAGNYQHDYADLHFNGVRNLCVNLLLIRNFAGFDHCIEEMEKHHVYSNQIRSKSPMGYNYYSKDFTSAFINGLKAEAALSRAQISQVNRYLEPALQSMRGDFGRPDLEEHLDRVYVAPRVLGVAALYEALYGSKVRARGYLDELAGLNVSSMLASYMEPEKRAWLAKGYMAIGDYISALNTLTNEEAKADKLLYETMAKLNPAYYLVGAVTGASTDKWHRYFGLESEAMMCHTLYKLQAKSAEPCYQQLLQHEFIDVFGGLKFTALQEYGRLQLSAGNDDIAISVLSEAVELLEAQRSSLSLDTSKLGFVNDKLSVYRDLVALYVSRDQADRAIEYAERAKARALIDLLASRDAHPEPQGSDQLQELLASINDAETSLAAINLNDDSQRSVTRGLLRKYQNSLQEMAPEFTSLRTVTSPRIAQLQSSLQEGEGLLEYFGEGDDLWVFILSREGVSAAKLPVTNLDTQVAALRSDLQNPNSTQFERSSHQLYASLVQPVEDAIQGFKRLTVVPHGTLHYLPFAALYDGERYLLEHFEVRVLPSASVLQFLNKDSQSENRRMLVLGNPDLDDASMDLPGAEVEAINLGQIRPGTNVLLRKNASETLLKANAGNYRYLHIASHGIFNAEDPMASALLLSASDRDDGLLSVAELFDLRLNADLVTLSACETALGEVTGGDDVIGFTRGFLYAGAESIVSSLWKVSDAATNKLMQAFYQGLPEQGKSAALRQAQLALKGGEYGHPYYWAAFQLTGQYD
jgi:CHAT domain-containing protein